MMMLVLKDLSVNIELVDAIKSRTMKKLPALKFMDNDLIEDPGDIENLIKRMPDHPLECTNVEVNALVSKGCGSRVYHKFCQLVKNADPNTDDKLKANLREELKALDSFLKSDAMPGRFLGGDSLLIPDCILLPKLLHIKVVAKAFKDFDIPEEFEGIHQYMEAANGKDLENPDSNVEAFTRTSPSEEVIVDAWARSMKVPNPFQHKKKKTPSTS